MAKNAETPKTETEPKAEPKGELTPEQVREALNKVKQNYGLASEAQKKAEEKGDSKTAKAVEAIKNELDLIKKALIMGVAKYDDLIVLKKMINRLRYICLGLGISCLLLGMATAIGLKRKNGSGDIDTDTNTSTEG